MRNVIVLILGAALVLGLGGCEQEGPAERLGEQLDRATERAGEAAEEAGEKVDRAVKDVAR